MRIERVEVYRVDGQDFATAKKAQDYVEGLINKIVQKELGERLGVAQCVKVTEAILVNRERLAVLLQCLDDNPDGLGE